MAKYLLILRGSSIKPAKITSFRSWIWIWFINK